ncbi:MAG: rhodanese-like domain-containing protein [Vulcanimicrobiaceae bacterium]
MSVREIDVAELERWRSERRKFVLLDVREPSEIAKAAIDGAVQIPMGRLAQRIAELDPSVETAVLCHHGGRSSMVADFLDGAGFASVANVDGGIDAYAKLVDPSIPRY